MAMMPKDLSKRDNNDLSRYFVFTREQWAQRRGDTPIGADFRQQEPPFAGEQAVAGAIAAPPFPEMVALGGLD